MSAPELLTDIVFTNQSDGGITPKKLNLAWRDATIQPAFITDKPATGTYATGDYLLMYQASSGNLVKIPPSAVSSGGGTGSGDMLKAVYDTNNNGVADTCDSLAYSKLTGAPSIPTVGTLTTQESLTGGGAMTGNLTINLVGDVATPTNGQFYGYSGGARGWFMPAPSGTVNPGTWTNLTYSTGWTQNTTAQYRVEVNGAFSKVICQGIINYASGAASLAFTLPAGAQPSVVRGCVLAGYDSSGDTQLFQATIGTGGAVNIVPMVRQNFSWPSATNGSVYLDSLSFAL